jgi:amidophosphoribosyltransferase
VALSTEAPLGVRDPWACPLILGRIGTEGTGGWVLASETCALDIVGADFVRDVEPGEVVVINDQGVHSIKPFGRSRERFCVFEYIYFARPDSVMEGTPVYDARKSIGAELARETAVPADVVVPAGSRRARGDGLRDRAASRSSLVSSATTMSAAPSSSRPTTSATSV